MWTRGSGGHIEGAPKELVVPFLALGDLIAGRTTC